MLIETLGRALAVPDYAVSLQEKYMGKYYIFNFRHKEMKDYDKLIAFEEKLETMLPTDCSVDGHEFGGGTMSLVIVSKSGEDLLKLIMDLIRAEFILKPIDHDIRNAFAVRKDWNSGDILMSTLLNGQNIFGRFLSHDKAIGPVIIVYDTMGKNSNDLTDLIASPIIIRATGMHPEVASNREWIVVGNIPLTQKETDLAADAPGIISGTNTQLLAANIHYGLSNESVLDIDNYLNTDGHPIPASFYFGEHPFPAEIEMLLLKHKDNEYFLDDIWMDAIDWAKGMRLDEAERILKKGSI